MVEFNSSYSTTLRDKINLKNNEVSPDYWGFIRILRCHPTTEVSADYWGVTRLPRLHPNTEVSPDYRGFTRILRLHPILGFHPNTEILQEYWGFTQILRIHPNIWPNLTKMKSVITWHIFEIRFFWLAPQAGHFEIYNLEKIQMGVNNDQHRKLLVNFVEGCSTSITVYPIPVWVPNNPVQASDCVEASENSTCYLSQLTAFRMPGFYRRASRIPDCHFPKTNSHEHAQIRSEGFQKIWNVFRCKKTQPWAHLNSIGELPSPKCHFWENTYPSAHQDFVGRLPDMIFCQDPTQWMTFCMQCKNRRPQTVWITQILI